MTPTPKPCPACREKVLLEVAEHLQQSRHIDADGKSRVYMALQEFLEE